MEATIDRDKGYIVADIKVEGRVWGDFPYLNITMIPRDESSQLTFNIALNDWIKLSAAGFKELADHI